jgi:glycosyltransferase involved in cell wall biosynthesis
MQDRLAVESLASGRPVIPLGAGGVRESVREGITGAYYERDDPQALASVVQAFDPLTIDPAACVETARQFGSDRFRDQLRRIVDRAVEAERAPRPGERPAVVTGLLPRRTTKRAAAG